MPTTITPFLMFEGKAEEAMDFYRSIFPDSAQLSIERYGPGEQGAEGTLKLARFAIQGQEFMCFDSPAQHAFTFTPAISLFVECAGPDEVAELFQKLAEDGQILMPLDAYPFGEKFAWVADRFGVSWQLRYEGVAAAAKT